MKRIEMSIYTRIGLLIFAGAMVAKNMIPSFPGWLATLLLILAIVFLTYGLFRCRKIKQVKSGEI